MSLSPAASDAPVTSLWQRLILFGRDIKLSHSVFALPFALLATFLAAGSQGQLPSTSILALVTVCMVLARTWAMGVNRLADATLDANNPRTLKRALPSGRLSRRFVLILTLLAGLGFLTASSGFYVVDNNPWPVVLSPIALLWLMAYSYTKRFTWGCHFWLGSSLALSPIAAAIATEPLFLRQSEIYLLAGMVLAWVAGFDVIYALQDVQVDRAQGLFSMPARLGEKTALRLAALLHLAALVLLTALGLVSSPLSLGFALGVALVAGLLLLEHVLIHASPRHHLNLAFFTVNGAISLLLGTLGMLEVILHVGGYRP